MTAVKLWIAEKRFINDNRVSAFVLEDCRNSAHNLEWVTWVEFNYAPPDTVSVTVKTAKHLTDTDKSKQHMQEDTPQLNTTYDTIN